MKLKYWLIAMLGICAFFAVLNFTEASAPVTEEVDCSTPLKPGHYRTHTIVADGRVLRRCRYA